ncbi:unnamed protein product, partial [Rotaria sp. Silwood1]
DVHRCRLLRRGIPAQPILNGYCGNYELGMPESMINDPAFNYETSTTINSTAISTQSSTDSPFGTTGIFNVKLYHVLYTILFLFFIFNF